MSEKTPRFDAAYLDRRRRQLLQLREELRGTAAAAEGAEADLKAESRGAPRKYEDDAQRLDALETEATWSGAMWSDRRGSSGRWRRLPKVRTACRM